MASPLDDLNFKIKADIADAMANVNKLSNGCDDLLKLTGLINDNFRELGKSAGLSARQVDLLVRSLQPITNTLTKADEQAERLTTYFTRKLMARAIEEHNKKISTFADGTQRARYEMIRLTEASQQLRIPASAPQAAPKPAAATGAGAGVNFVRVAAAAGQLAVMGKMTSTMKSVRQSMVEVGKTSQISASYMDRFRMGLAAPKVNPEMNVIKTGIEKVSDAAAKGVNKIREAADALASDLPGTVGAAAQGLGKINVELDKSSQTMSKHVSRMQSSSKGLTLLGKAFPFLKNRIDSVKEPFDVLKSKAESAANKLDQANATVAAGANKLRTAEFIMSGSFRSLGGSADIFARASYHANLPIRLMKREWEGATRVVRAATHAFNFVTHPIHAVSLSVGRSRDQFKVFRAQLPEVNSLTARFGSVATAAAGKLAVMIGAQSRASGVQQAFKARLQTVNDSVRTFANAGLNRVTTALTPYVAKLNAARQAASSMAAAGTARAMAVLSPFAAKLAAVGGQASRFISSLQLGTRAFRVFAHATYLTGPAATMAGKGIQLTAKGLMALVSPAKSAASSIARLTGVQNTFIGKALGMKQSADAATASLSKMGSQTSGMGSLMGGTAGKAFMLAGALMALVTGAMAWGASTAMATEKNNVVFGTMLHDMEQGKAVVSSLQGTKAAGLFDNQELLDSGRLLFKAGVSAKDLAGKTDQLATIATATSTELGDLTRIYQQGANAGSFGLDKINQLAERGIDIYGGLSAATGKSGGELKKMISDGKIGLTEMDGALAHLTEGHGIYAGAMENVAGTASGMMSQMKNNTQQALGSLMGYGLAVFKPILAAGVMFTEKLKLAVVALEPVFVASMAIISGVMNSVWTAVSDVALGAFSMIFGESEMTFQSVITWLASMLGAATFIFSNLGTIANYAWTTMKLGAIMAFNDVIYFFTDVIPAYLDWFSNNWTNMFRDMFVAYVTFYKNLLKNVWAAMTAIWDFIASGGTAQMEIAFVPMLDGFKKTMADLPNVPDRAMTQLETQLTDDLGSMGAQLGTGLQQSMDAAVAAVGSKTATELSDKSSKSDSESAADKTSKKAVENKAVMARSSEGQSVVAQLAKTMAKGDKEKKAQDAQISAAKDLKDISREVRRGAPLAGKKF